MIDWKICQYIVFIDLRLNLVKLICYHHGLLKSYYLLCANNDWICVGTPSKSRLGFWLRRPSRLCSIVLSAFYGVVTPLRTSKVSIPLLFPKTTSVLKLSPTIKNLLKGTSSKLCWRRRRSKHHVSGLPMINAFYYFSWLLWSPLWYLPIPAAASIRRTRLPPDGLRRSLPSFLSMLVPIS